MGVKNSLYTFMQLLPLRIVKYFNFFPGAAANESGLTCVAHVHDVILHVSISVSVGVTSQFDASVD